MVQLSAFSVRALTLWAAHFMTTAQSRLQHHSRNLVPGSTNMAVPYDLPPLGYAYDALEPHFDQQTMEIHYTKHHRTYVNNLNNLLKDNEINTLQIDDLVSGLEELLEKVPAVNRTGVRNNAGGHSNHSFFWKQLKVGTTLDGPLKKAIEKDFGSVDDFKAEFNKAAASVFGSGWAWLVDQEGTLKVVTTANQDSPLSGKAISGTSGKPIIGLDVWEHAYYLKFKNLRADYIQAYWQVVNWDFAQRRFAEVSKC